MLVSRVGLAALVGIVLAGSEAPAQAGPEPVASLLASIRVLKTTCGVRPVPSRLAALVEANGYPLSDFLPRGRYFGLVQNRLAELRPPRRGDRDAFCARLAEQVRTSPLNGPPRSAAPAPRERPRGTVNLNTASLEELNGLGAGMIGRTIIYGRPYRAPEDLVDRRLLTYRDFARIRDRVTVR